MAHIVEFRPPSNRSERRPRADAPAAAEIILFPGVRYERWEDDTPPAPSKGHGTASRGRPRKTG